MNELERLKELEAYRILDTPPEEELEELALIASAICDTPISLVSLIDENRQWFKVNRGLNLTQTPRADSFCQHALQNPNEVLVIEDSLKDERFKNNSLVLGHPHIRFYAGAPLETENGYVLGTLCILDDKPRQISENQKNALMLLAKRAMRYLETRRQLLEQNDKLLSIIEKQKKLTDQAPGVVYEFEMKLDGSISFPFISEGFDNLNPLINVKELKSDPRIAFKTLHPDDIEALRLSFRESYKSLIDFNLEYRVLAKDGSILWHSTTARPEKKADGTVVWYGSFQDITDKKEYINTVEQILFDISHVMRKPVANMLGLASAINSKNISQNTIRTVLDHIQKVSEDMDDSIRQLNDTYTDKRSKLTNNLDDTI